MTEKIFSDGEVQAIAKALGDTSDGLSNTEIDELFALLRIDDAFGPGTKWRRIHVSLWNRQCHARNRRAILEFIRRAMQPARHLRNPDRFEAMRHNLNLALAFSGLMVAKSGELASADAATTIEEAQQKANALRTDLKARGVHPDVLEFCRAELIADNYFHAVLEAVKSVAEKLRNRSREAGDGSKLVEAVLCGPNPIIAINPLSTDSEKSEQAGFANLIKGTFGMFRNPTAHEARVRWQMTKDDAEDLLSLVSLIHRRLDTATYRRAAP